jgi:hypothetical protein
MKFEGYRTFLVIASPFSLKARRIRGKTKSLLIEVVQVKKLESIIKVT